MRPSNYPSSPEHLWNIFYDFTQTPRPSKSEDKIIEYLTKIAKDQGLEYKSDQVGNLIIYVPGTKGRETEAPLIIQNHVDMVTDALPGKQVNFLTDPIQTVVDGNWLKADGTTLGADNGVGCAAALAIIFEEDRSHPPLELLFTIDEETGLHGALGLESKYLKGRRMLNLDTEEWGSLYVGCAGGIDYELTKDLELIDNSSEAQFKIEASGFVGGHSGLDIQEQRGNCILFLASFLKRVSEQCAFNVVEMRGGKAHNIIPRDGFVVISTDELSKEVLEKELLQLSSEWKSFLPENDQDFKFKVEKVDTSQQVLSLQDSRQLINFLNLFPHGAHSFDLNVDNLVGTSNNFARFLCVNGKIYTQASLRFMDRSEIRSLEDKMSILGETFGMNVEKNSEYPSWKPVKENKLRDQIVDIYREALGEEPEVLAIHAGLECGILRDKIGPIDVISFGPNIRGAHSPDERIDIESVEKFWKLFKSVLTKI